MTGCDDSYCTCDEHSHKECNYCYSKKKRTNACKKVVKVGKYGRDGKDGKDGEDGKDGKDGIEKTGMFETLYKPKKVDENTFTNTLRDTFNEHDKNNMGELSKEEAIKVADQAFRKCHINIDIS